MLIQLLNTAMWYDFFSVFQISPGVLGKGVKMCQMATFHKTNYLGNYVGKIHCDTGVPCSE